MQKKFEQMMNLYHEIKEFIRKTDKNLFERWKSGGFLVDDDIVSMYPALGEVLERLEEEDEDFDEEDE